MTLLNGDCFELIKDLEDNSIDLIITSPPYSDIISYGKSVSIKKTDEYCDWILPLFDDIFRVLKKSGSFILNINDKCVDGYRSPFIYDLISRSQKETDLKLYDTYFWCKETSVPNGSNKRFRTTTEFIFHFVKSKDFKFYMDRVYETLSDDTIARYGRQMNERHGTIIDGHRKREIESLNIKKTNEKRSYSDKKRPDNVFRFKTAGAARDNLIKHPAPFHKELPSYFINLLTDEKDFILDPFSGIGTTGISCKDLGREYIGFELNKSYFDYSVERINNYTNC